LAGAFVFAGIALSANLARADETAAKQKAEADEAAQAQGTDAAGAKGEATKEKAAADDAAATKAKGGPKANEIVRAKEGEKTALPSVAGRPVRRYAEQGILEAGGNVTLVRANAFTQLGASPTFGWFFIDYVQLSIIPSFEYVSTAETGAKARVSTILEPSFHMQIVDVMFGFFGSGVGFAYEKTTGVGLAVAPRVGINLLVGGSGVLTAAFSFVYTATKRTAIEDGSTAPHTSTQGFQLGYSVAW